MPYVGQWKREDGKEYLWDGRDWVRRFPKCWNEDVEFAHALGAWQVGQIPNVPKRPDAIEPEWNPDSAEVV